MLKKRIWSKISPGSTHFEKKKDTFEILLQQRRQNDIVALEPLGDGVDFQ